VATRLVALVAIPAILGLTLAGVLVARDVSSAAAYGRFGQVAGFGQQVTGLAQALESERDAAATFVAAGRPATGAAALRRQYASTDGWAAQVRRLAARLGSARLPARTRASAATALGSIAELPALRRSTAQGQASALDVTSSYSAAITGLFPVIDGTGDLSSVPVVISSVRALSSLSALKDQAWLQKSILNAALTQGTFAPGMLSALTVSRAQQASDLAMFRAAATSQESWALARTLAGSQARNAQAVEQRAIASGDGGTLALGPQATAQWQAGMSYTVGWLRHAEQQLAGWITANARAQQLSAQRSAIVTGGVAGAGLILVLVLALLIVRSVVLPLRRLAAETLDAAESRLPEEIRALTAESGRPLPVLPADPVAGDEIGQIAGAVGRLHQEAVRLAGEEARLRDSAGVLLASYFRRSHALHDRLLWLIDNMELSEDDPERLSRLFQMDNLATRMRRHSDIALVLAGFETPRLWTEPVALVDLLRAAASEIEEYDRIAFDVQPEVSVSESAAVDTVHLLAELLENATAFSSETTQVTASGYLDPGGGALISITDAGPGLPDDQLRWLNWQLGHPTLADERVAHQMGVFAIAHLAARQGISVVLTPAAGRGITAEVFLPAELIAAGVRPDDGGRELGAGYGRRAAAGAVGVDPRPFPHRITAGPEPPEPSWPEDRTPADGTATDSGTAEDGTAEDDEVPLELGAPVLPPRRGSRSVTVPEPAGPAPGGALPIFESVESEYGHARDLAGAAPAPAEPGTAPDEPAEAARSRLAGFQQGSRRARAMTQMERDAT
jgi:signal transduction histidine kinase